MKVADRTYMRLSIEKARTPEYAPEVKAEDGIVWVKAFRENGAVLWIRADALMDERTAKREIQEAILRQLEWSRLELGDTKAEMKRRLIARGIISR